MKIFFRFILIYSLSVIFLLASGFWSPLMAYVMSSGNYRIQSDNSLTPAGGEGSSVNYVFRDTMGEVSSGRSDSASYGIRAGYQEMQEVFLSISVPDNIALAGTIYGMTGGTATGSIMWTVIADNSAGFSMQVKASGNTAMVMTGDPTYYFDDYTPASAGVPDYNWQVAANAAEFGFSIEPETVADTVQNFLDNASDACNQSSGSQTADKCWLDFDGTSYISIVNRSVRTDSDGEDETVKFKAQSTGKFLKEGEYVATITTLAVSN